MQIRILNKGLGLRKSQSQLATEMFAEMAERHGISYLISQLCTYNNVENIRKTKGVDLMERVFGHLGED